LIPSPRPLYGQVALVTGAARRIGACIARLLHAGGMDIVLHFRHSAAPAQALCEELEAGRAGSVLPVQADLHDTARFPELMARIGAWRDRLDLLVNNASSFYPTPLGETTEAQWDDLLGSNLKAPFFLACTAAPLLRASGGSLINLVDIHAERPLREHAVYCIAKAGSAMMVKALARELGPEVRVNGVSPGAILWPEGEMGEAARREILERTALRRAGAPEDIARTVLFLHRDASYITGQIVTVDGGRSLQQ
jgi:pteridine reductase